MGYSEYKDLTPINNINNGDEYLNALEWALNNPKVKNIALAGPYGAGKSSMIETYLNREKDKKNIYEQHKFAKKYLKIFAQNKTGRVQNGTNRQNRKKESA